MNDHNIKGGDTLENLKLTIMQTEIVWHEINENLDHIESLIKKENLSTDLIILPEMFNTGFTMKPEELSEDMNGPSVSFLRRMAREVNADIAGSIAIKENGCYYNRLLWVKPEGDLFTYDKRHLFRMSGEEKIYTPGSSLITVNLNGWKIRPFICYDLRFPAWIRNKSLEYDLAIFVFNWPTSRDVHGDILLRARAIENQCYVVGVNRTGLDGNGLEYSGRSTVIDYYGDIIHRADRNESIFTVELFYDEMESYRESFPAWMDGDQFELKD